MKRALVEAALILVPYPVTVEELAEKLGLSEEEVREALNEIKRKYSKDSEVLEFCEYEGRYRLEIRRDLWDKVKIFAPVKPLSKVELKLLAFLAQRGGKALLSSAAKVLGSRVYSISKELERKGFVKREKKGKKTTLRLTGLFEKYFGKLTIS